MPTLLSIIILSYNTKDLLKNCLDSLVLDIKDKELSIEIIVVDNGSTDGSVEMVKKYLIQNTKYLIRLIENKENVGFAKGNNIGLKQAKGDYIMLLNSDTLITNNAIGKLIKYLENNKDVDIVGPRLLNFDRTNQPNCGKFPTLLNVFVMLFFEHFIFKNFVRNSPNENKSVDWLMGAAFVARKNVFEETKGLDENFFMYMEEVEWFYRTKLLGFRTFYIKNSEIYHLGGGSSKSGRKQPILLIYKGILFFFKKHKGAIEYYLVKLMLRIKAGLSLLLGHLTKNIYLIETYGQAIKEI